MGAFDSLNFNVNVTDNASVVLSNIEKRLGQVTTQSLSLANAELRLNNSHIAATQGTITYENSLRRQQISKLNLAIANNNLAQAEARLQQMQSNEGVNAEVIANAENRVYLAKINVIKAEEGLAIASANVNSARLSQEKSTNSVAIAENNLSKQMLATNNVSKTAALGISSFFSKLFTGAIIARYVGGFLANIVEETGSYIENLNLLSVAYGDTYQETVEWAVDLAEGFGLATNEVIKFTGTFRQLATSMGLVKDTADSVTQTIIELGYDISALYNIGVEDAMEKLQSGLYSGYTRPMRALGIDVSQNQVDNLFKTNEALKNLNVSAMNLKQGDKVLARLLITMQAASNSFGTMNREINTLQSQIRILQGSFSNFKLAMGDLVHEPIKQALIYINAFIIGVTDVIRAFKPLQTKDETFVAFSNLGEEADEAGQSLDGLSGKLAKFDKFNVLGQGSQSESETSLAVTEALTAELQKQQDLYAQRKSMFSDVTNMAVEMAKSIKDWFVVVDENGNFKEWTNQAIAFKGVLTALIGIGIAKWAKKALVAFASLESGAQLTGLAKAGSLLTKIFTPLGLTITGIAVAILYMYKTNENFRESINRLFTALLGLIGTALNPIIKILDNLTKIITPIIDVVAEVIAFLVNIVAGIVEFLEKSKLLEVAVYGLIAAFIIWATIIKTNFNNLIVSFTKLQFGASGLLYSIVLLVGGIAAFVGSFNDMSPITRAIGIIAALAGAIAGVAIALHATHNWAKALMVGGMVAGGALLVTTMINNGVKGYADGGYTNANLIMTHENGKREWVGKAAGSSAIVNDTQMSDIMEIAVAKGVYNALSARSELSGGTTTEQPIVIKIGEEVVFNAVRRTAKKQGRDIPLI